MSFEPKPRRRLVRILIAWLAASLATVAQATPQRHALIVAVGSYPNLPAAFQLDGPARDAEALRSVLLRRWGFAPGNVQMLVNQQAGKRAILAALRGLQASTRPDDEVLIYFSGHGTSALSADTAEVVSMPDTTGAFVAADFKGQPLAAPIRCDGPAAEDGLIVGCRDLRPLLDALDNERSGRRRLWVISDSCYSGQQVRSVVGVPSAERPPTRMVPLVYGEEARSQMSDLVLAARAAPPPPYPYRHVQFLAASAQGERAADIPAVLLASKPTFDGLPHGAFTDALLGVLEGKLPADFNGDGYLSLAEVHRAIAENLDRRSFAQTPQRLPSVGDDTGGLGNAPVLGMTGAAAKPAPALKSTPLTVQAPGAGPALRQGLLGLGGVALVNMAPQAELRILSRDGQLQMVSAGGDQIALLPDTAVEAALRQVRQLAWARQLQQVAELHRRSVLNVEAEPAAQGGNFLFGQGIAFAARPDRAASLLLLNVNADGTVTTLFPITRAEAAVRPAGQLLRMPEACVGMGADDPRRGSACIVVGPPVGMDLLMAFAFDTPPASLAGLMSLRNASVDDARLADLLRELPGLQGRFAFSSLQQRALEAPKAGR